jgi:nicotinamide mononucleotide transporter
MSWIEWVAAAITLVSVYLSTRQHIWSWPTAIVGVAIYLYIFWLTKLYADVGLQVFFIVVSFYGWYEWLYGGKGKTELTVSRASLKTHAVSTAITICGAVILGTFLRHSTDAALPYADSTLAAFSVLAQWQMARKYLENWFIWIAVDVFYIGMYSFKHLYVTAGLYAVFIGVCVMGLIEWKQSLGAESDGANPLRTENQEPRTTPATS